MGEAFWKALTTTVLKCVYRDFIVAMQVGFVSTRMLFEGGTFNNPAMTQFVPCYDPLTSCFEKLYAGGNRDAFAVYYIYELLLVFCFCYDIST